MAAACSVYPKLARRGEWRANAFGVLATPTCHVVLYEDGSLDEGWLAAMLSLKQCKSNERRTTPIGNACSSPPSPPDLETVPRCLS